MWNEINSVDDKNKFIKKIHYFHDSCIKEMKYVSGAYVGENLSMFPINNKRVLKVIFQGQFEDASMIELEFSGLKYLKLFPVDCNFTCEIFDATMILNHDGVLWCDEGSLTENDIDSYQGTVISATKLRWRVIENCMGDDEFYKPAN